MDRSATSSRSSRRLKLDRSPMFESAATADPRIVQAWIACALWASLLLVGLIVCVRRISGALTTPLPGVALAMIGLALAAWALATRRLAPEIWRNVPSRSWDSALLLVPSAMALLVAVALSLPESGAVGLLFFWAPPLAEVFLAWRSSQPIRLPKVAAVDYSTEQPIIAGRFPLKEEESELGGDINGGDLDESELDDELTEQDITQQMVRRRGPSGKESIHGTLRVDFAPGEQTAIAHVAFCPPLAKKPELSMEQIDGPTANIKATQVFAHGARLEIKLTAPTTEPTSAVIEFAAQS